MLGRLAKWLRFMGYDTAYDSHASDPELARRCRSENRVLLTRDQELASRRGLRSLLIHAENLQDQLREVVVGLGRPEEPPLRRCGVCNSILQPVDREFVRPRAPKYIVQTHREFRYCPACDRIYWPGTHYQRIQEGLDALGQSLTDHTREDA